MPETNHVGDARRILVYGVTGSGKSTLARRLAELTGRATRTLLRDSGTRNRAQSS